MQSIMQTEKECFFCKSQKQLEVHHALSGYANRKKADADGLVVYLCRTCHADLHDRNVGEQELKREAQRIWMKAYRKTVDDFRDRFGKNYL